MASPGTARTTSMDTVDSSALYGPSFSRSSSRRGRNDEEW